jgi:hypothetical protein
LVIACSTCVVSMTNNSKRPTKTVLYQLFYTYISVFQRTFLDHSCPALRNPLKRLTEKLIFKSRRGFDGVHQKTYPRRSTA